MGIPEEKAGFESTTSKQSKLLGLTRDPPPRHRGRGGKGPGAGKDKGKGKAPQSKKARKSNGKDKA